MPIAAYSAKVQTVRALRTAPGGENQRVSLNEAENALCWLFKRKGPDGLPLISAIQFAAGEKLREDYTFGHVAPRVTAVWSTEIPSGSAGRSGGRGLNPSDRALAAKERCFRAIDAVGPELGGILMEICCMSAGLEQAERSLSLPQRSGKAVLGLALTRLARHYGLIRNDPPPPMRHAGLPGFRPAISP